MRWRDIVIGAIISLIVSVIAGSIVWMLTHEPKIAPPEERLRYSVQEVASFVTGENKIGIVTIKIANVGNKTARNVHSVFVLQLGAEIKEKQIAMSSGPAGVFTEGPEDSHTLNISLPTLAPSESLEASLLVGGSGSFNVSVGVRSDDSVGVAGDTQPARQISNYSSLSDWLSVAAGLLPLLIGLAFMAGSWKNSSDVLTAIFPSPNNTAFIYLQKKSFLEAIVILQGKARSRGLDMIEMANLALAFGLKGELEEAERLFTAAEWWAKSRHARAVIAYNRATLSVSRNQYDLAKTKLREAVSLSRRSTKAYFRLSEYFAEATGRDLEFKKIVEQA